MPGHARKDLVREGEIGTYHCWSRCVQRAFLCGYDPVTGKDFDHRRTWIQSLLEYQASVFAVDVGNYNILSNHQHLIARTRPDIAATWSNEQVAWKWKLAWPKWVDGQWVRQPTDQEIDEILSKPDDVPQLRANLASLSWFMARWKEPISKMCNAESETKGHFYEQRFGSRELVDDPSMLCGMVYVDLNQMKAGMASSLEDSRCSAIQDRLLAWKQREAQESLEDFQRRFPKGYDISLADMAKLFADSSLSPIGDQGPLLLLDPAGAYRPLQVDSPPIVVTDDSSDSVGESEGENDQAELQTDLTSTALPTTANTESTDTQDRELASPAKPADARKPTWERHRRLQRGRRRRASDNPILGIPRKQYLDIVQRTAEQLADVSGRPPPGELPDLLRRWGIEPSRWLGMVEHFGDWFHRAVGRPENLSRAIAHSGRKWIQGIRMCRNVFT